jgi:hypothetical protein
MSGQLAPAPPGWLAEDDRGRRFPIVAWGLDEGGQPVYLFVDDGALVRNWRHDPLLGSLRIVQDGP